jgi:hypothetical protein
LEIDVEFSSLVSSAVVDWWNSRRTPKRVGFLNRSIEMLFDSGVDRQTVLSLWESATDDVSRFWDELSTTDQNAWIRLGTLLRVAASHLASFTADDSPEKDPLALVNISKVAIVCLNESAAAQAASEIARRAPGCQIVLVTDKTANNSTASAQSADVILFVWRATKHAVYRAFDKVREKLQYVSGSGATSIVSALEQWASYQVGIRG